MLSRGNYPNDAVVIPLTVITNCYECGKLALSGWRALNFEKSSESYHDYVLKRDQ